MKIFSIENEAELDCTIKNFGAGTCQLPIYKKNSEMELQQWLGLLSGRAARKRMPTTSGALTECTRHWSTCGKNPKARFQRMKTALF
jgi:hypothetical protein